MNRDPIHFITGIVTLVPLLAIAGQDSQGSHSMTDVGRGRQFFPIFQRELKIRDIFTCARIYTHYNVISVISVIRQSKIAMTVAMTLLRNQSLLSLRQKGGLRHV